MGKSNEPGRQFDSELQMFCEAPREPDLTTLRFLRWLGERGRLEHPVFGRATGVYSEQGEE